MKRSRQVKFGTFTCQCGCGQKFTAEYITRTPQYVDKSHRNKVLAKRKADKREASHKELFAKYKQRRAELRKLGVKNKTALNYCVIGTDREFNSLVKVLERTVRSDD